ncbi:SGNH hydrolase domain-containing protein [Pseudoalteromonas sp. SR45-5]
MDGKPLYFDDDHLNLYGTKIISPVFDEVFMNH